MAGQYSKEKNQMNAMSFADVDPIKHAKYKVQLKQDQDYKCLMKLQPHLVQLLLVNIDSNIEAVRLASLKTLEYLLDTLGCSLDESIIQIFVALVQTYPQLQKASNPSRHSRRVISFFEDSWSIEIDQGE